MSKRLSNDLFGRVARAAMLATGTLAVCLGSALADETLEYGVMTALSGTAAPWGQAELASVEIAADDINNAGGIKVGDKTYKIKVVAYDHGYDPTKAVSVSRQAAFQDGVKFLEVLGGGIIPSVLSVTEPEGILVFGQAEGNHWMSKDTQYAFKIVFSVDANAKAIFNYLKTVDPGARVVQFFPDDDMGHSISEGILKTAQATGFTVEQIFNPRDVTDFYPIIARIMRDPPQYIDMDAVPGAQYALLIKQALENGYTGKFIFSSTIDIGALRKANVLDKVVGALVAPAYFLEPNDDGKRWLAEMDKKTGGNVQVWTSSSYDALMLLKAAMEKAGSMEPEAIRDALRTVSAEGLSGTVKYQSLAGTDLPAYALVSPVPVAQVTEYKDDNVVLKKVFELGE